MHNSSSSLYKLPSLFPSLHLIHTIKHSFFFHVLQWRSKEWNSSHSYGVEPEATVLLLWVETTPLPDFAVAKVKFTSFYISSHQSSLFFIWVVFVLIHLTNFNLALPLYSVFLKRVPFCSTWRRSIFMVEQELLWILIILLLSGFLILRFYAFCLDHCSWLWFLSHCLS